MAEWTCVDGDTLPTAVRKAEAGKILQQQLQSKTQTPCGRYDQHGTPPTDIIDCFVSVCVQI